MDEERRVTDIFCGKNIVIGVSGSIAAFKVAGWVSELSKREALVSVVMTEAAGRFITPLTFAALSGRKVFTSMFDDDDPMNHISLGREADMVCIAPATANTIARLAAGMGSDLLTTTVLATTSPVVVCPAMNHQMFSHPATSKNVQKLRELGYHLIEPDSGVMACKEEGKGRLPEWSLVEQQLARILGPADYAGRRVLVTAGPTREPIDPARFLSNRSSGRMGFAIARAAYRRGAEVTLVSGPVNLSTPYGVNLVRVQTASEMYETVMDFAGEHDIIIKSAAVADYRPAKSETRKVKKEDIGTSLVMERNPDILLELGRRKQRGQILVGFAAESDNHEAEGLRKLTKKNLDLIAVNNISATNTGFECDTNQITLLWEDGAVRLPLTSKDHTADLLLDKVLEKGRVSD